MMQLLKSQLICLFIFPVLCQGGVKDSLLTLISEASSDTAKIKLLNELAYLQIDTSFEEANLNIMKAEQLSQKIEYKKGIAVSLYNKGRNHAFNNEFDVAIEFIEKSQKEFEQVSGSESDIIRCQILLGWVNDRLTQYFSALNYYQNAETISKEHDLNRNLGAIYINIGRIHNLLKDSETALAYYHKAGDTYRATNNREGLAYYYTNIGYINYNKKVFEKTHEQYDSALVLARDLNLIRLESNILQNKILAYIAERKPVEAEKLVSKVHRIDSSIDDKIGLAYLAIAKTQIDQINSSAIKHIPALVSAYDVGVKTKDVELQRESARLLSELYTNKGEYKKALTQNILATQLKDSIASADLKLQIKNLENKKEMELQKKDQVIREKEFAQSLEKQKFIRIGLGTALLLLSLISFFQYRNSKTLLKTKNELVEKNSELRVAESKLESKNRDLERYIEHNIELEQFAHIASHDIKSPLRTIASFSGLLQKQLSTNLTDNQRKNFEHIKSGVSRLDQLVTDLLDFSVVNSQGLNLSEFSLYELFEEVKLNLKYDLEDERANFNYLGPKLLLTADRIKIKQIIQNLLSNSLKFRSPIRKPLISMEAQRKSGQIIISVTDNGMGIEPAYSKSIFNKFTQLNTKDKFEGTGLGLALCKKYVDKHQGEIWLEPTQEQGSKFIFTIKDGLV